MKTFILSALGLTALAIGLLAQPAPQPSQLQSDKLVGSFSRAVLLQQQALAADQAFASARDEYTKLAEDTATEMKLPKGTTFVVDVPKKSVTVQLPTAEPPKPAPTPDKKEDKK